MFTMALPLSRHYIRFFMLLAGEPYLRAAAIFSASVSLLPCCHTLYAVFIAFDAADTLLAAAMPQWYMQATTTVTILPPLFAAA